MVDEQHDALGNRTYADFARRSPIPDRGDGHAETPRNSPTLVNASDKRPGGLLLHFDGEFSSGHELATGTLTGRNYGWLPTEKAQAIAHIAHVIRDDDGSGALAQEYGGSYSDVLSASATVPAEFRLPRPFRINVSKATDAQILTAVGRLIEVYLTSLSLSQDEHCAFNSSPYDVFLAKNHLPRKPKPGESTAAYSRRLFTAISHLSNPKWVSNADQKFTLHSQDFAFGPTELAGLKIFFTGTGSKPAPAITVASGGAGNCVACHTAPAFTDFGFHNTGASQEEYDSLHGAGAFMALEIPSLSERRTNPNASLPPSALHPNATGVFASAPKPGTPGRADLGLWNTFANPDRPNSQAAILRFLTKGKPATKSALLPHTIGRFKTAGLRDLADSAPYLHHGGKDTIEDVLEFYQDMAALAREGAVRNPAPELLGMALADHDLAALAAFLRSLNEDYD
jgi:cytochrome c peroxidase